MHTFFKSLEPGVYQVPYLIPAHLESRRDEFEVNLLQAQHNLRATASRYGWEQHTRQPFFFLAEIYDYKPWFDARLLYLCNAAKDFQPPATFTAALEQQVLISVTPELYLDLYPEGQDSQAFEKLLRHELAHRLHIRILNGQEERMGPIWFFEGFATLIADQYPEQQGHLSAEQIWAVLHDSERGSYRDYNQILKYFLRHCDLPTLVQRAGEADFHDWLRPFIDGLPNTAVQPR